MTATTPPLGSYVEGAIGKLQYFETYHGAEGVAEINGICGAHVLAMDVDEAKRVSYCGCEVRDGGRLAIVFRDDKLGTNTADALDGQALLRALNEAPPAAGSTSRISYAARAGIRADYEPKIEAVRQQMADMLARPDFKLSPNFDEAFARLSEEKRRKGNSLGSDWETRIGPYTLSYFEGVASHMKSQQYDDDDMLQDGFNEAVDKAEVAFRIVDKLQYDSYCEVVVEDGVLYVQVCCTATLPCHALPARLLRSCCLVSYSE